MKGPAGRSGLTGVMRGCWDFTRCGCGCEGVTGDMHRCRHQDAAAVAILIVIRSVDDPSDLAPVESAGAHKTGFYGDVDGGVGQIFAAEEIEGGGEGDDLGVGGAIVESFRLVVSAGDDPATEDDDGADRDLLFGIGVAGFTEGLLHVVFVVAILQKGNFKYSAIVHRI